MATDSSEGSKEREPAKQSCKIPTEEEKKKKNLTRHHDDGQGVLRI